MSEITREYLEQQRQEFIKQKAELAASSLQIDGAIALVDHLLAIIDAPGKALDSTSEIIPGLPLYQGADGELHYAGIPEPLDGGNHASES